MTDNWNFGEMDYLDRDGNVVHTTINVVNGETIATTTITPQQFRAELLPGQEPCNTYWGSHGCNKEADHEGHHLCDCCDCVNHPDVDPDFGYPTCVGAYPYYGPETNFYH